MSIAADQAMMPPRIVHLPGGLRALDDRSEKVTVQLSAGRRFVVFPTPPYAELYKVLGNRRLHAIGVEFLDLRSNQHESAPDWQCASPSGGFKLRSERQEWVNIRHAAYKDKNPVVSDMARRCLTYCDLLSIRLFQLSNAYNHALFASRDSAIGNLIQNYYVPYIDAAIHAFVADAGSFRDLIAEVVWRFVMGQAAGVTTYSSFIKKAKASSDPLVSEMIDAGKPGGWVKTLTDLRNDIVHAAPMGGAQFFHSCQIRNFDCGDGIGIPALHYPLLTADGLPCPVDADDMNYDDELSLKAALGCYMAFFDTSVDGLEYTWRTIGRLIGLLEKVRSSAAFRSEEPLLTEADLAGELNIS